MPLSILVPGLRVKPTHLTEPPGILLRLHLCQECRFDPDVHTAACSVRLIVTWPSAFAGACLRAAYLWGGCVKKGLRFGDLFGCLLEGCLNSVAGRSL